MAFSQFLAGAAGAVLVVWLVYLGVVYRSSRAAVGRPVADFVARFPGLGDPRTPALLYFHSAHCPPCRQMTPTIDALAAERPAVYKVDVADARDVAKALGVRVTPTLLVVRDGRVARALLGARPRAAIERALDAP